MPAVSGYALFFRVLLRGSIRAPGYQLPWSLPARHGYDCVCTDNDVVSNPNRTQQLCACSDIDAIADDPSAANSSIAQTDGHAVADDNVGRRQRHR
jgi:hypothetical protein